MKRGGSERQIGAGEKRRKRLKKKKIEREMA